MTPPRRGTAVRLGVVVLCIACADDEPGRVPGAPRPLHSDVATAAAVTLVGAGNVAQCGAPGSTATAALLDSISGTVFTVGDAAYPDGSSAAYQDCYDPSWGSQKARTSPVPGNRDYGASSTADGYFAYFGSAAGDPAKGYYSYDVGAWHVVVLNSNYHFVATALGSPQEQWLRADLAAHPNKCTLAYWHHPLISSRLGVDETIRPLWQALYDGGVDVVLTAHDHSYERFAPVDALGNRDPVRGIRQFVVGTGGRSHQRAIAPAPNSEIRNQDTYGVLRLRLRPFGYYWNFLPEARHDFTDSGANACH